MANNLLWLILLTLPAALRAEVLPVGPGQRFVRIGDALAASKPGDVIQVQPGLYREADLTVKHRLRLEAIAPGVVLDAADQGEGFIVKADGITIQGFTIRNTKRGSLQDYAGIHVYDSRGFVARNNRLDNCYFGILLSNSRNVLLETNQLDGYGQVGNETSSGNGLHLWRCDSITIRGNTATRHRDGIYFEFVTNSLIERNLSHDNLRYGLHFMFSNTDRYLHNTFRGNGAGVAVMYSRKVHMLGNLFDNNRGSSSYGLLLKEINDSQVKGNVFSRNTIGIHSEGSNRIQVQHNVFRTNGWGIRLMASSADVDITSNDFIANTFDMSSNGQLVLNRVHRNYWDKYQGFDLGRDGTGDVPYRPVTLFAVVIERIPTSVFFLRSMMVRVLDQTERLLPSLTPGGLQDTAPAMRPVAQPLPGHA